MTYENVDRRGFLQQAGLAVTAGAVLPVLGSGSTSAAASTGTSADQLFKAGEFDRADRAYARLLREDHDNAHAMAQRGYIALLANRFGIAERFLAHAVNLAPSDIASKQRLAECYVRQDQLAPAIPLLRSTGSKRDEALAEQYAHINGAPWQVHGAQSTRVPWYAIDPLPFVEASVNGGRNRLFLIDSYATAGLTQEVAEELGLRAFAELTGHVGSQPITLSLGVLDSLRLGDLELRNIPIQWTGEGTPEMPRPPDGSRPAGAIGTTLFYHFLTTMDYMGKSLVLRRKTGTQLRRFQAKARQNGYDQVPLWLAGDHFPCTLGSLRDYGPRIITLDTGGLGPGVGTTVEIAERAGLEVDYDHPVDTGGTHFPIKPDRISLGDTVRHDADGIAGPSSPMGPGPGQSSQFGFDIIANFSHDFVRPFAITFDYTHMHLNIAGKSP
ncbi:Aspartyl protease [Nonomuraea solani]|uniref:Aspartyl protease n=1 Tax=Nonomuraea solani TaxID=1144553 RepID=A0A1H6F071_9ACTN|nr:aspartyl protease family protein [Nonomuraea solani]SEH03442.1 Aspartyl protease [Nonomuraea solani]